MTEIASPAPAPADSPSAAGAGERTVVHEETYEGYRIVVERVHSPGAVSVAAVLRVGTTEGPMRGANCYRTLSRRYYMVPPGLTPEHVDESVQIWTRVLRNSLHSDAMSIGDHVRWIVDHATVPLQEQLADALHYIDRVIHADAEGSEVDREEAIEAMREWRADG